MRLFSLLRIALFPLIAAVSLFHLPSIRPVKAELYPIRKYSAADGLAQNFVNRIVVDSRGFIWICTNDGLSRFDGYGFTNFGHDEGLRFRNVRDLIETKDGHYWLATNGGLVRFNPNGTPNGRTGYAINGQVPMFTLYQLPIDKQDRPVISLARGPEGSIWCGTAIGLFQLTGQNGTFSLQPTSLVSPDDSTRYIRSMIADRNGIVWLGLSAGIIRYDPQRGATTYGRLEGLPDKEVSRIYEDSSGRLWAGTGHGLFELDPLASPGRQIVKRHISSAQGFPGDGVRDICLTDDGQYWIATDRGLARFRLDQNGGLGRVDRFLIENGLSDYYLTSIISGPAGSIWIGTANAGLMKWVSNGFTTYGRADGIISIVSVSETRSGEKLLAGYVPSRPQMGGVAGAEDYQWRVGTFERGRVVWVCPNVPRGVSFTYGWNQIVFQDHLGDWWVPTQSGLYRFPAVSVSQLGSVRPKDHFRREDGLANNSVIRIYEDSRGDIWISTSENKINHLDRWERASNLIRPVSRQGGLDRLGNRQVTAIREDRQGAIWLGLSNGIGTAGLACYQNGEITILADSASSPRGNIQDILFDRAGHLWAASTTEGLIRIDNPLAQSGLFRPAGQTGPAGPTSMPVSYRYYGTSEGLISNRVTSLIDDNFGRIYAGTSRGLDQLDPETGLIRHFSQGDGLALGSIDDLHRDVAGDLWIGTTLGLSHYSPTAPVRTPPPPIYIDRVRISGMDYPVSARGETELKLPEIPYSANQLEIEYVGLSFATGDLLNYQSRLDSVDPDWVDLKSRRSLNYANLGPGSYRLLLRASNVFGEPSPQPASISFKISTPFMKSWLFYIFISLAGSFLIGIVFLVKYRQATRMAQLRTQISNDLHDEVGSNLSQITILSEIALRQAGSQAGILNQHDPILATKLRRMAEVSRAAVDSMSDIVWAVNPRRDTLLDLIQRMRHYAGEALTGPACGSGAEEVTLQFNAPSTDQSIPVNLRRHLYLFFKEAVTNIVKHSGATVVRIDIEKIGRRLHLRIFDNGRGFVVGEPGQFNAGGNGLQSLHNRASQLNAEILIESSPGNGTTIDLDVPLHYSSYGQKRVKTT